MYTYGRSVRLSGHHLRHAMTWATSIGEKFEQITGLKLTLFAQTYSAQPGTLSWGFAVPDMVALETAVDKLRADEGFNELTEKGTEYTIPGSLQDRLGLIVHPAAPTFDPARVPEYSVVVDATIAGGQSTRGLEAGVRAAQLYEQITGLPLLFVSNITGDYGGVHWIATYSDVAEMEQAQLKLNTDPTFVKFLDSLEGVFVDGPGAGSQTILRRVI